MCNGPPKLHYWACQSAVMALRGYSCAEVVFLTRAAPTRRRAGRQRDAMCQREWQYHVGSTNITTYFKCSVSLC